MSMNLSLMDVKNVDNNTLCVMIACITKLFHEWKQINIARKLGSINRGNLSQVEFVYLQIFES